MFIQPEFYDGNIVGMFFYYSMFSMLFVICDAVPA